MPLYVYPAGSEAQGNLLATKEKQPNLAPAFVEVLSERLGLPFEPTAHRGIHPRSSSAVSAFPAVKSSWTTSQESEVGRPQGGSETRGTMMSRVNPEDLFCYAYAEFLKIDFPRLPLTSDAKCTRYFTAEGAEERQRSFFISSAPSATPAVNSIGLCSPCISMFSMVHSLFGSGFAGLARMLHEGGDLMAGCCIISIICMDFSGLVRGCSLPYSASGPIWLRILADRPQTIAIAMLPRPINQPVLPAQP